jgi:hypothetical protein
MSRIVDVLEVMRLWGNDDSDAGRSLGGCNSHQITTRKGKSLEEIAMLAIIKRDRIATRKGTSVSGANSDPSYHERLNFESLAAAGLSVDYTLAVEGANAGPKLLSTRKPLLPSTGGSAAAPG